MKAYVSNADELAAFCGEEPRGDGSVVDGVWCIRIWGNVGDNITLRYYCATNKYIYHSAETIVLKDEEQFGCLFQLFGGVDRLLKGLAGGDGAAHQIAHLARAPEGEHDHRRGLAGELQVERLRHAEVH